MRNLRFASVVLLAISNCLFANPLTGEAKEPDWKPLMDGKTLKGWHPVGDGQWSVEDGAFVGRANNEKLYGLSGLHDIKPRLARQHRETARNVLKDHYQKFCQPEFWKK